MTKKSMEVGAENAGYLSELVKQVVEAGTEIKRHNKELLDRGGVLERLNDNVRSLTESVEASNANWKLARGQISGQGVRLGTLEVAVMALRQLLTDALLRLGSLENTQTGGVDNQIADGPIRVLVVDDIVELRRTIERILSTSDMTVLSAGSLEEARNILISDTAVEVVLVDVKLPDGSGLELLQEYKHAAGNEVEFVIMSAAGDPHAAEEAIKRGAYSYLEKPFRSNGALVVAIQKAAEHQRLLVFKRKFSHAQTTPSSAGKDHP